MENDDLLFGVLNTSILELPIKEQIEEIGKSVENYSYSELNPPHFTKLFTYLVKEYSTCANMPALSRLAEILGNIAGYKLGMNVRNVLTVADKIMITLLASTDKTCIASAVNFYRKAARVIGPRFVIRDFIKPNYKNVSIQTGISILVHQLLIDFQSFPWESDDFEGWVYPLSAIPGVGYQLVTSIKNVVPDFDDYDKELVKRPPSVPLKGAAGVSTPVFDKPPPLPPNSARPSFPRLLPRRFAKGESSVFQLTERQTAVREFIDQPFGPADKVQDILNDAIRDMGSKEWEDRSAAYNTMRRILRYEDSLINSDNMHNIVSATIEDIESTRAALALSALSLLQETITTKAADMELEIGRVVPVIVKRFSKSAQFFEQALSEFMDVMISNITPKRFVSLMVASGDSRSSKVQTAIAKYIRNSLRRCTEEGEKLFRKNSKDIEDLVVLVSKLLSGSLKSTRDAAKDCVSLLSTIYGESFANIVQKALPEGTDASKFLRATV